MAGASAFTMLVILGVPSPLALATIVTVLDLIPLVGATLGAVIVGVVTALFGAALLGVLGAILAIPCAAAIQIGVRGWLEYRREETGAEGAAIAPTSPSSPSADR